MPDVSDVPDAPQPALVIMLHGVGSNGADLEPLGRFWQAVLPGAVFVSPDAPEPFDQVPPGQIPPDMAGAGARAFQWFSIGAISPDDRARRLAAARAGFDRLITAIIADHGFTDRHDRVALVGFSQGSMMLLDAIASGRWTVGAGIAFSGRLVTPDPLTPGPTPLLLIHGEADPVVPADETRQAARRLHAAGADVTAGLEPGLVHTISQAGAAEAGRFLTRHLGPAGA